METIITIYFSDLLDEYQSIWSYQMKPDDDSAEWLPENRIKANEMDDFQVRLFTFIDTKKPRSIFEKVTKLL